MAVLHTKRMTDETASVSLNEAVSALNVFLNQVERVLAKAIKEAPKNFKGSEDKLELVGKLTDKNGLINKIIDKVEEYNAQELKITTKGWLRTKRKKWEVPVIAFPLGKMSVGRFFHRLGVAIGNARSNEVEVEELSNLLGELGSILSVLSEDSALTVERLPRGKERKEVIRRGNRIQRIIALNKKLVPMAFYDVIAEVRTEHVELDLVEVTPEKARRMVFPRE